MRGTKLDELPQLLNVLNGDMSIVGSRPEVPRYVELFRLDFEEILKVRPGITDAASVKYRNEAGLLGAAANPEDLYVRIILPEKLRLAKGYARRRSLLGDVKLILKTLVAVVATPTPEKLSGFDTSIVGRDKVGSPASLPSLRVRKPPRSIPNVLVYGVIVLPSGVLVLPGYADLPQLRHEILRLRQTVGLIEAISA